MKNKSNYIFRKAQEQEVEKDDFRTQLLKKINAKRIFPIPIGEAHRKQTHLITSTREGDLTDKELPLTVVTNDAYITNDDHTYFINHIKNDESVSDDLCL